MSEDTFSDVEAYMCILPAFKIALISVAKQVSDMHAPICTVGWGGIAFRGLKAGT